MNTSTKPRLLSVVGATTTGKTSVGIEIARQFDGEVINGDSRLFYRGMNIATAKPSDEEMGNVPHHLIDILNPDEEFNLAGYLRLARATISDICERGKLPVIVGGSGQYIWALLEGWEVPEIEPDNDLRAELEQQLSDSGIISLAQRLTNLAPDVAGATDLANPRRVIRALERVIGAQENKDLVSSTRQKPESSPYDALVVGLKVERSELHERVQRRLAAMLANGWVAEVESLVMAGYTKENHAMSGIGYRQMIDHLAGDIPLEEAVNLTKIATNRLIRHQNNWFKPTDPRIRWFDMTHDSEKTVRSIVETVSTWDGI